MKKLRDGSINQLLRNLDRGLISRHHFDAQFNLDDGTLVSITFRDAPEFYFRLLQPKSNQNTTTQWATRESPGDYFTSEESYTHREFSAAFGRVSPWVNRLIEDLAVHTSTDDDWVSELRANLDEAADALPEPEKPFSEEEVEAWSQKFEQLIERLKKLEEENQIQKGLVSKLKSQLEELKKSGVTTPKRTWLKSAGHKVLDVFEHGTKAGIKALAEGAVKALLGP